MTRQCTLIDLDFLYTKAVEFNKLYYTKPLDEARTLASLEQLINVGVCYRTDHGAIVGYMLPDPFRDRVVLAELGWYSTGRDGIRLLKAFIEHGRKTMCDDVLMTTLHVNTRPDKLLERLGFTRLETNWSLSL